MTGHCNIHGNEMADRLAKFSLACNYIRSVNFSLSELLSKCRSSFYRTWQDRWGNSTNGIFFDRIHPAVYFIDFTLGTRKKDDLISKILSGQFPLNSSLYRADKHPNGLCDSCQVP